VIGAERLREGPWQSPSTKSRVMVLKLRNAW
jgi:hypothetical protein